MLAGLKEREKQLKDELKKLEQKRMEDVSLSDYFTPEEVSLLAKINEIKAELRQVRADIKILKQDNHYAPLISSKKKTNRVKQHK